MKKASQALVLLIVVMITTAPSPPLISVTGTVYNDAGLPAPGTQVTFTSLTTQVVGGVEVPPTSFSATADPAGSIVVSLPQGLRVSVVIGRGAPQTVTMPNLTSVDLSTLLAAVQIPPPANVVTSVIVPAGGDYQLTATNPTGGAPVTLSPGSVFRINGNPVSPGTPTPGQFLGENANGTSWQPFSFGGDLTPNPAMPGSLTVNHFTLSSNASFGGFKGQNAAAGTSSGDLMVVGLNRLDQLAPANASYSMGGNGLTNLANGVTSTDAATVGQLSSAFGTDLTPHSLTGSGSSPFIQKFNLADLVDPRIYGVSFSTATTTGTFTSGSNTFSVPSHDFSIPVTGGMGFWVPHMGSACTLPGGCAAPAAPTVFQAARTSATIPGSPYQITQTSCAGDAGVKSPRNAKPWINVASGPSTGQYSVSVSGSTCTYTFSANDSARKVWIYYQNTAPPTGTHTICFETAVQDSTDAGTTPISAPTCLSNVTFPIIYGGSTRLTETIPWYIQSATVTGAYKYLIYESDDNGTNPAQSTYYFAGSYYPSQSSYFLKWDNGTWNAEDIPVTPPTAALNRNLYGTITAQTPTQLTMSLNAGVSSTATVQHDDKPGWDAFFAASGGRARAAIPGNQITTRVRQFVVPSGYVEIQGQQRQGSKLLIFGDGGGVAASQLNGQLQIQCANGVIEELIIISDNSTADTIVNADWTPCFQRPALVRDIISEVPGLSQGVVSTTRAQAVRIGDTGGVTWVDDDLLEVGAGYWLTTNVNGMAIKGGQIRLDFPAIFLRAGIEYSLGNLGLMVESPSETDTVYSILRPHDALPTAYLNDFQLIGVGDYDRGPYDSDATTLANSVELGQSSGPGFINGQFAGGIYLNGASGVSIVGTQIGSGGQTAPALEVDAGGNNTLYGDILTNIPSGQPAIRVGNQGTLESYGTQVTGSGAIYADFGYSEDLATCSGSKGTVLFNTSEQAAGVLPPQVCSSASLPSTVQIIRGVAQTYSGSLENLISVSAAATVTPDLSKGLTQFVTFTGAAGYAVTLNAPLNIPEGTSSNPRTYWTIELYNNTAGALGTISLAGGYYKGASDCLSGGNLIAPAQGKRRLIKMEREGSNGFDLMQCSNDM